MIQSAPTFANKLIDRLPDVTGSYQENAALAPLTWFRTGGPAEVLFLPKDEADLQHFLTEKPTDVPVTIIGVGSNLLVRDGGVDGVVIRLGRGFAGIEIGNDHQVTAGAAVPDAILAQKLQAAGIGGLEFLSGIPGVLGGALRMNAGAYGGETKDRLVSARAIDGQGKLHVLARRDMDMTYRHNDAPVDWIFTSATFQGEPEDKDVIKARMDEIKKSRSDSQPIKSRTGGSTFANPEGHKTWQLIDSVGGRGFSIGDAAVSELHCNFLINKGNATAADIEAVGEEMRRRVKEQHGIDLRWEIRRIGKPLTAGATIS